MANSRKLCYMCEGFPLSTPYVWLNSCPTRWPLNLPSSFLLIIHRHPHAVRWRGRGSNTQVLFLARESSSDSIASFHFPLSMLLSPSPHVCGSLSCRFAIRAKCPCGENNFPCSLLSCDLRNSGPPLLCTS